MVFSILVLEGAARSFWCVPFIRSESVSPVHTYEGRNHPPPPPWKGVSGNLWTCSKTTHLESGHRPTLLHGLLSMLQVPRELSGWLPVPCLPWLPGLQVAVHHPHLLMTTFFKPMDFFENDNGKGKATCVCCTLRRSQASCWVSHIHSYSRRCHFLSHR